MIYFKFHQLQNFHCSLLLFIIIHQFQMQMYRKYFHLNHCLSFDSQSSEHLELLTIIRIDNVYFDVAFSRVSLFIMFDDFCVSCSQFSISFDYHFQKHLNILINHHPPLNIEDVIELNSIDFNNFDYPEKWFNCPHCGYWSRSPFENGKQLPWEN